MSTAFGRRYASSLCRTCGCPEPCDAAERRAEEYAAAKGEERASEQQILDAADREAGWDR